MDNLKLCKWLSDEFGITDQQYDAYIHSFNKDVMSGSPVQDNCWQQRAEAAEAKLAGLEKQQPYGYVVITGTGAKKFSTRHPRLRVTNEPPVAVFTRAPPAADLAEIVPEDLNGKNMSYIADKFQVSISEAQFILVGFNACRTTILRKIEEVKLDYFGSLVSKARISADKAMVKFPQPNYVLLKVAEEAGEVVQAGVHYAEGRMKWEKLEGEVVQLLAMLIRLVTEGDQVNGIAPPESCRNFIPAPAAELADLVPDEITHADAPELQEIASSARAIGIKGAYAGFAVGANWMRAAILRKIEEAKK